MLTHFTQEIETCKEGFPLDPSGVILKDKELLKSGERKFTDKGAVEFATFFLNYAYDQLYVCLIGISIALALDCIVTKMSLEEGFKNFLWSLWKDKAILLGLPLINLNPIACIWLGYRDINRFKAHLEKLKTLIDVRQSLHGAPLNEAPCV